MSEYDPPGPSPYEVLNVPKDANDTTIRSAHRKLVLRYHPDRTTIELDKDRNTEQFHLVQRAYEILIDGDRRRRWDENAELAKIQSDQERSGFWQTHQSNYFAAPSSSKKPQRKTPQRSERFGGYTVPLAKMERKTPVRREVNRHSYADYSPDSRKDARNENRKHKIGLAQRGKLKKTSLRDTFKGVQGLIDGINVDALADTGADKNFMNDHFAKEHEIRPRYFPPDQRPSFLMGNGRTIQALGQVEVSWKFRKELENSHILHFFVLPDSIFDVMIGGPFLYETETLAINKNRLSVMPKPRRALHIRIVNFCGSPSRRLNGMIRCGLQEFQRCTALPDSGAEPNLLKYDYVKKKGWLGQIVPGPESCRLLVFADGSTARTEGQIALQWTFEKRWCPVHPQAEHAITFDVLDGCPVDVLLGQDFLDDLDVFTTQSDAFTDLYPAEASGLNLVIRAMDGFSLKSVMNKLRKKKSKVDLRRSLVEKGVNDGFDADDELQRRAEFDQKLFRAKKGSARVVADERRESERRSEWDKQYASDVQSEAIFNRRFRSNPRRRYDINGSEYRSPLSRRQESHT